MAHDTPWLIIYICRWKKHERKDCTIKGLVLLLVKFLRLGGVHYQQRVANVILPKNVGERQNGNTQNYIELDWKMATHNETELLTEEFLMDLYYTCLTNEYVLGVVCEHLRSDQLPDKEFQGLHKAFQTLFKNNKKCPSFSLITQSLARQRGARALLGDIYESGQALMSDDCVRQLEAYIRQVQFQKTYREVGELYNKQKVNEAYESLRAYSKWADQFNLSSKDLVNVISEFQTNLRANKAKKAEESQRRVVDSFYIDELDNRNNGRNLRGQLTCFLASTGVGKSHIARWIGRNACQFGGLNVLHIQLEGSKEEVVDAYSASLVGCSSYTFSNGRITDEELERTIADLAEISGKLYVKSYSRFGNYVTTTDVYKTVQDYKKITGEAPDVLIIDSMDLLHLPQNARFGVKDKRLEVIEVANSLKDMATEENMWVIVTYQSTIEDREKLNDEKFLLSEYNCSEAKGLSRPLTHLITLNQTTNENKENTMRINIAKSRFFKKGDFFRIATDYEHENFYDRIRSLNLAKLGV